jgi:hypothetical protein
MKVKIIEKAQVNFHPSQQLNKEELTKLKAGLCNANSFNINGTCVCHNNCFLRTGKAKKMHEEQLVSTASIYETVAISGIFEAP